MRLGVCYYPEQWPEARWATDAALMAETGLQLVRIGEFAWSRLEPGRGHLDWGWLDRAIDTLAGAGLGVVLGTPTATPPVWLMEQRPEILSVGPDGRRRAYGSRRHTCPTSPAYRDESRRIVAALAARYSQHEAIVAWQIDNEPGNHDSTRCWCELCQRAFGNWLRERYGTIDALNAAWGTAFWSMDYPSFDAVRLPVPTMTAHNPSLELAHRRFGSASAVEALAEQRTVLSELAPGRDVYTNLYLGDVDIDSRAVARPTGLGAVDVYPHGLAGPADVGFVLDLARGTALPADAGPDARGGRAWIVEQQPGPVNWTGDNPAVPDGQVRLWCWQAALHGIETLLWFRWRAARAGQEQHHAALLRHDGTPDQGLIEARRVVAEVAAADPAVLERPPAELALVVDVSDAWLLDLLPHVPEAGHRRLVNVVHAAARQLGFDVDVVPADADLTGYRVVLAPALQQTTPDRVARLEAALAAGVTVVTGPRALVRDEDAVWSEQPLPAGMATHLGARISYAGSPAGWPRSEAQRTGTTEPWAPGVTGWPVDEQPVSGVLLDGERLPAGPWLETLAVHDEDTHVLATAIDGPLDGRPVVVQRGRAVHVGAASLEVWTRVLGHLTDRDPIPGHLETFIRAGRLVTLDHLRLRIDGVGEGIDG